MTPDTYTFNGNVTTFLGLIGVSSTLLIVVVAFRRFFNSPYNVRHVEPVVKDGMTPWGHSDLEYLIQNKVTEAQDSDYQDFWENEDSINTPNNHDSN